MPWRSRSPDWIAVAVLFFWRSRPIPFRELRVNEQIRIPQVRLFDDTTGEAFDIVPLEEAKRLAVERELDLVEVAPHAQPPVCRLMDYGRYKFEEIKKEKDSRRSHNVIHVKEMKLRPKISEHDFRTKFGYVKHFLEEGDKVKLTIMFRGREMVHQEYGRRLLDRMAEELKELATIERSPLVEGRNMIMILNPVAKKAAPGKPEAGAKANGETPAPATANGTPAPEPETVPEAAAEKAEPVAAATKPTPAKATTPRPSATRSTTGDAKDSNP